MPNFNMSDYVTVAERLTLANEQLVTVVTEPATMLTEAMGYIRATVALKDGRSATATASFRLDLQGKSAQATNPIEDCETSAIGRALGFLGYGSSKSVASREEVQEAQRRATTPTQAPSAFYEEPPICPTHNKPMRPGKNGGWFCANKLPDGSWCKARPIKQPQVDVSDEWDAIDNAPSVRRRAPVDESLL